MTALEQLVTEPTRGVVIFDFVLGRAWDLAQDFVDVAMVGNSDHSAIKFSTHVNAKLPLKAKTVNIWFQKGSLQKEGTRKKETESETQIPRDKSLEDA